VQHIGIAFWPARQFPAALTYKGHYVNGIIGYMVLVPQVSIRMRPPTSAALPCAEKNLINIGVNGPQIINLSGAPKQFN
jgi:hypothetical protein